jgi:peptidoglycan/xylan/chitin deacetylase (PgdA/CDA1 family)
MYLITTPWWLRMLFPGCVWQMPSTDKSVYLTFDDGPHPVATPFVLQQLQLFHAKATFFCIGKNVIKYPAIYRQLLSEGHTAGNHTMHHVNGWKVSDETYLQEIANAAPLINSRMLRPPYGRIRNRQIQKIKNNRLNFEVDRIVMWSVLSADFDTAIDGKKCLTNVTGNVEPGSIIVFHDSAKAMPRLQYALPKVLQWLADKGYSMKSL